jgi:hypothetical protein
VPCDFDPYLESPAPCRQNWFIRVVWLIVAGYLVWLAVTTTLRIRFPWDLFSWPESPFMTNMLKLDRSQPLFSAPAAANSFVYSPGLEYLTFVLLKPLGAHLDIRYCRLCNVLIGLAAAAVAGLFIRRALLTLTPNFRSGRFAMLGAAVAVLVIFRNFTADATHPDNLVMAHTAGLFLLTLAALQNGSLGFALATMLFAALGVFAKQILLGAFAGPALVFFRFGPWGKRKAVLLGALGALASAAALASLWRQPLARFFTFEVLSHQGLNPFQLYWMAMDSLQGERAILWFLGLMGVSLLWAAGPVGRKFVLLWLALGAGSVWPNAFSYLKQMGTWNNLIIFQLWLLLLVWPAVGVWLNQPVKPSADSSVQDPCRNPPEELAVTPTASEKPGRPIPPHSNPASRGEGSASGTALNGVQGAHAPNSFWGRSLLPSNLLVGTPLIAFVLLLIPTRLPPHRLMYACCEAVQEHVTADLNAGLKVLVAHGAMYQLRAGSREVPLDRANSSLELRMAGLGSLTQTAARIHDRYYDRIYLTLEDWYEPAVLAEIEKNYAVDTIIRRPKLSDRIELGRCLSLMGDCRILSPRPAAGQR